MNTNLSLPYGVGDRVYYIYDQGKHYAIKPGAVEAIHIETYPRIRVGGSYFPVTEVFESLDAAHVEVLHRLARDHNTAKRAAIIQYNDLLRGEKK